MTEDICRSSADILVLPVQISVTIVDPDTGAPIGALTVGVDAESLL